MKKKYNLKLFVFAVFLFVPFLVNADTCEYFTSYSSDNYYKIIVEFDDNNYDVKTYKNNTLVSIKGETYSNDVDIYDESKSKYGTGQIPTFGLKEAEFRRIVNSINYCPVITTTFSMEGTINDITFTETDIRCEGTVTTNRCAKSSTEISTSPETTTECEKTITTTKISSNISGVQFKFKMNAKGEKFFCARFKGESEWECSSALDMSNGWTDIPIYYNAVAYDFFLPHDKIANFYIQDSDKAATNSFSCAPELYICLKQMDKIREYWVTDDREEAKLCDGALVDDETAAEITGPLIPPDLNLEDITCESLFYDNNGNFNDFGKLLQDLFLLIKVLAPILLIGLSSLDYIKAITSKDADELKKANDRFVKRLIAAVALFLLPFILDFVFDIFGVYDMQTCGIK